MRHRSSPLNNPSVSRMPGQVATSRRLEIRLMISALVLLTLLMSASAMAEENLFAKHYRAQNTNNLRSMQANPDTQIFVSNHADEDNISMLEKGYDMMGSSGFDAGEVSPNHALEHGKAIKADTVLVYTKYGSAKTADSQLSKIKEAAKKGRELTEKDLDEGPTTYKYFASYWAKLPPPTLGIHIIKLTSKSAPEDQTTSAGLKILAVIKQSPAAMAGLMRGDTILAINGAPIDKPEDLFSLVKKHKGTSVDIRYLRNDSVQTTQAKLN